VGVAGVAVGGRRAVGWLERQVGRASPALAGRVAQLAGRFVDGLRALARAPLRGIGAALCTAIIWIFTVLAVAATMRGFGMTLGLGEAAFNWAATLTGMVLLPTPGFLGAFEAASVGSLALLGIGPDLARTFALVMHLEMFAFTVASGGLFLL